MRDPSFHTTAPTGRALTRGRRKGGTRVTQGNAGRLCQRLHTCPAPGHRTILNGAALPERLHRPTECNHVKTRTLKQAVGMLSLAAVLVACGGGGGGGGPTGPGSVAPEMPASRDAAARFLTQATFGPIDADVDRVQAIGYAAWIDEQFTKPVSQHRLTWEAAEAAAKAADPTNANAGVSHKARRPRPSRITSTASSIRSQTTCMTCIRAALHCVTCPSVRCARVAMTQLMSVNWRL